MMVEENIMAAPMISESVVLKPNMAATAKPTAMKMAELKMATTVDLRKVDPKGLGLHVQSQQEQQENNPHVANIR